LRSLSETGCPGVINSVEPFVSSKDIYAGARWQTDIASELDLSNFGIVCVTRENQAEPWLNFEAGALAKAVELSRVIPLAIDLTPSDIALPLGQFQAQEATREGIQAVVLSINAALGDEKLDDGLLRKSFDLWWPELESQLTTIEGECDESAAPVRSDRELLEETLDTVRALAREQLNSGPLPSAREALMTDQQRRVAIRKALRALPEPERRILELRFGFEGMPWTLEAIGQELDITRERVRQLEGQALKRLEGLRDVAFEEVSREEPEQQPEVAEEGDEPQESQ
jgi:RNA polymerase sigma factor (sigma-70 family)